MGEHTCRGRYMDHRCACSRGHDHSESDHRRDMDNRKREALAGRNESGVTD